MTKVLALSVEEELQWAMDLGALPVGQYEVEVTNAEIEVTIRNVPGRLMELTPNGFIYTELAMSLLSVIKALGEPIVFGQSHLAVRFSLTRLGSDLNRMNLELMKSARAAVAA